MKGSGGERQGGDPRPRRLRIGIVGLGRVATATHLPVLRRLGEVSIEGCAEASAERTERVRGMLPTANLFTSYEELYRSGLVDAVYICLPPHLHCPATLAALDHGLHVLCEKPMGASLEEARAMTERARAKGLVLMPGFKYRYSGNLQQAAAIAAGGLLGTLVQVHASFMTPGPYISWDPKSDWYLEPEQGGVTYDIGVHIVELLHLLVPDEITEIGAQAARGFHEYDTPTSVASAFRTSGGAVGSLNFSWRSSVDHVSIDLFGTAGALHVGLKHYEYENAGTDPKDRIASHARNAAAELATVSRRVLDIVRGAEVSFNDLEQARAFVRAVRGEAAPAVSGEDAVYVHRVLRAVTRSLAEGRQAAVE